MKKLSLVFVVITILALVTVGACGGGNGEKETTAATTAATSAATTAAQTTEPSNGGGGGGGDFTWDDMPVYGGADHIQEFNMSFAPDESEYSKFEWRYYESNASVDDIVDFYKDKMPENGWDEQMWMDMGEIAYGMYMKNNEKDAAMVWISRDSGETMLALWRASE